MSDVTTLSTQVDPEVLANMLSADLPKAIKLTAIAPIDNTLEGRPGSTVTVPRFEYIGDAKTLAEGQAIDADALKTSTDTFEIKKIAKAVELTDEAVLSGYGDPVGEAGRQLMMAIASKIDNDIVETANQASINLSGQDFTKLDFIDNIEAAFVDSDSDLNVESNDGQQGIIFMNPKDVNKVRKAAANNWDRATDLGDSILATGVFGGVLGWQIIRSRKIPVGSAVVAKPGAMKTYLKKSVSVETQRNVTKMTTTTVANEHYGVAIYDDSKLLVINKFDIAGGEANPKNKHKKPAQAEQPAQADATK
ncbi:MAG: hypothetical protein [Caudoviricetes sp.]|nr:MAG: hypothetical protein [Caudoviricetes sp.]